MATADLITTVSIPGIHQPFTNDDMKESTIMYNGLPRIHSDMHVDMDHVKKLLEIIARYDRLGKLSIHLVHQHDSIANDTVRLESDLKFAPGRWNRATVIDSLDLNNIHGVVFKLDTNRNILVAFEFGEGPSPVSANDVDDKCVKEFTEYLIDNNLSNIFALEFVQPIKGGQPNDCTAEIEVDKLGTIVLPKSMVNAEGFLPTGWSGPLQLSDSDPPAGQSWAKRVDGSHKVFINKPIKTEEELVKELVLQGIVKV